jgi:uncharacterized protein YutD
VISTENTAFKLTDNVLKAFNQKAHVGIFFDLAKAFDFVNYGILFAKLLGIQGTFPD